MISNILMIIGKLLNYESTPLMRAGVLSEDGGIETIPCTARAVPPVTPGQADYTPLRGAAPHNWVAL